MAVDLKNLIDLDLLSYFKTKLDLLFNNKVDKVDGKGLSTNDYTTNEKNKLSNIAAGAQVNVLEGIQKNGDTVTITNKIANISVPTKTSDITNDSGFITANDVPAGVQPTTTTPKMDGTAAVGTETKYAKGDHVHPSDTTKVDKIDGKGLSTNDFTNALKTKLEGIETGAEANVQSDWNQTTVSADDYIKNKPSIPTKVSDLTNDSGYITSADVPEGASASVTAPLMDAATAVIGTSTAFARGDHVHPSDTSKVDKVAGKGLSTNDYTTAEQTKLAGIDEGAEVNVIEVIKVNNTAQTVTSKTVNIAVPTAGSSSNTSGYVAYSTYTSGLGTKADSSAVYTKNEIDQKLVGAMNYKGTKATTSALPSSDNVQGDVWHINADGSEWAWNGSSWEELGTAVDLSGYVESSDLGLASNSDIDALFT